MKIKICGLNNPETLRSVFSMSPDMIGLIFYKGSKRYAGDLDPEEVRSINSDVKKVGVFVNASLDEIQSRINDYSLDMVQLHGDEGVEFIKEIKENIDIPVIKVFRISKSDDLNDVLSFERNADFFLFDTKGEKYGGNGQIFDWSLLEELSTKVPFFLSGGLGLDELRSIPESLKEKIYAVDMNSKLETKPGFKDPELVKTSIEIIRNE